MKLNLKLFNLKLKLGNLYHNIFLFFNPIKVQRLKNLLIFLLFQENNNVNQLIHQMILEHKLLSLRFLVLYYLQIEIFFLLEIKMMVNLAFITQKFQFYLLANFYKFTHELIFWLLIFFTKFILILQMCICLIFFIEYL